MKETKNTSPNARSGNELLQYFKMAFSKVLPEAVRVTLFNESRNNDEEKCDTKSFWHGFTESHFEILYR